MSMDIGLLYSIVAGVAAIVNAIILSRVRATRFKETIDESFCGLLMFFMIFAMEDCIWGALTSEIFTRHRTLYVIFSYGFHLFAAISAYMWSGYTVKYTHAKGVSNHVITVLRRVFLLLQLLILGSNIWTHRFFMIDENSIYHTYGLRTVNFAIQMSYFGIVLLYGLFMFFSKKKKSESDIGLVTMVFSFFPLVFGLGQLMWPDAPMYSLGFMVSGVCIYSVTVAKEKEDFFERLLNEERDRLALQAAEQASKAKTDFLFNMSHDIRTPMNAIIGFTNIAKKNIDDKESVSKCLDKVLISGDHLLTLINDVLDMSRIESGKVQITDEPANIEKDSEKLLAIVGELAENKSVHLEYEKKNIEHRYVSCDTLRLNQLLINILSNAVKYTPEGGTVKYTMEETECDGNTCTFRFIVKDNGIGMSKDFLSHIYDEFERAEEAVAKGIEGTGLGMSIVKRLADMMEVKIGIESEQGKGTTVTCLKKFELCDRSQVAGEEEEVTDSGFLKGKNVLLVDDNELNREIATDMLEDMELTVETAANGQEAYEKVLTAEAHHFDFVFMDIQMPVLNGYEATRKIRAIEDKEKAGVLIIAMTANAFEEDRRNALESGMNDHLTKPINDKAIIRTLSKFM